MKQKAPVENKAIRNVTDEPDISILIQTLHTVVVYLYVGFSLILIPTFIAHSGAIKVTLLSPSELAR